MYKDPITKHIKTGLLRITLFCVWHSDGPHDLLAQKSPVFGTEYVVFNSNAELNLPCGRNVKKQNLVLSQMFAKVKLSPKRRNIIILYLLTNSKTSHIHILLSLFPSLQKPLFGPVLQGLNRCEEDLPSSSWVC